MARRTETAVLDAAERLMRERGYRAMTIQALAAEADVAIGTIYGRFGGKHGVVVALAERAVEANERYFAAARAAAEEPFDEVVALADAYVRFHRDHPLAFRLVALSDLDEAPADQVREARARIAGRLDALLDVLAGALRRAAVAGSIRDVPPKRTARLVWAATNGVLALHARGGIGDRELRATLALWREVWLAGLRA
jgi:TetR/AcrR family transcriptional regulator